MRCPQDIRGEGGADIGPLLEGVWSALEEPTWLMWQMWATHTAIELELQLLHHLVEYVRSRILGSIQRVERGAGKWAEGGTRRRGGAWSSGGGEGRRGGDNGVGEYIIKNVKKDLIKKL